LPKSSHGTTVWFVKLKQGPQEYLANQTSWLAQLPTQQKVAAFIATLLLYQTRDCGHFNGNAVDDDRLAVRDRGNSGVPSGPELLFPMKTHVAAADGLDINDCPTATLEAAKANCKATFGGIGPKMSCLMDYCFAGKEVAMNKAYVV